MFWLTFALSIAPVGIQHDVEAVRNDFAVQVARCGRPLPKLPAMVADTSPAMIRFDDRETSARYPLWSELPPATRQAMATAAADSPSRLNAKAYFSQTFQRFLIPHELGHYLEILGGQTLSWWDSEYQANQVAVAYRRLKIGDRRLKKWLGDYWAHESKRQPTPVPAGEDVPAFFNKSRFDPATYGWYQEEMARRAWVGRNKVTFCGLIRQKWPKASRP